MSLLRLFLRRSVRHYSSNPYPLYSPYHNTTPSPLSNPAPSYPNTDFTPNQYSPAANHSEPPFAATSPSTPFAPQRSYGFSSAEEAAAERRRRKRRLRIEPPLYALRSNPQTAPAGELNNVERPRLPDQTSALVGPRLNLHNRVQSLIRAGDLDAASYIARQAVFQRVRPTVFTCNAIIAAMYRAKRYGDAKALFHYFFRQFNIIPNIVSYNNLIVSHCESNEIEEALEVYKEILETAPFSPSSVTYRHLTKGLVDAGRIDDAVSYLREMLHKGNGADSLVFNNVILGYLNLGNLDKANELFDELKERCTVYDGAVNATFMDWFFKQGRGKEAMESYRDLMAREYRMVPATRNVLLETLLKHEKMKEAWDLFHGMLDDHTPPTFQAVNADTINMMVNLCFKEGKIEEAMDVFKRSGKGPKSKPFYMDMAGYNNLIMRFCELEMMDEADQLYKELNVKSLVPDVTMFRTFIDAYIKLDRVEKVIEKYSEMVESGLRVIPPYANKWFAFMIEKGRVSDCLPILAKMTDKEPKPDVTTFDVVLRALVQEGNFDNTAKIVGELMTQGVGITASLKELLLGAFDGVGRRVEIENVLNLSQQHIPYTNQNTQRSYDFVNQNSQQSYAKPNSQQSYGGNGNTQQSYANPNTQQSYANSNTQQSYANQYSQQSYANQYSQQSYGNQYSQQSYANQNSQKTYGNQYSQQSYANQNSQQSYANGNDQQSYANQSAQPRSQPQMTQEMAHSNPMPEQEVDYGYVAGRKGADLVRRVLKPLPDLLTVKESTDPAVGDEFTLKKNIVSAFVRHFIRNMSRGAAEQG